MGIENIGQWPATRRVVEVSGRDLNSAPRYCSGRYLYLEEPPVGSSHGHHRARRDARGNLDHELLALSDGLSDGLGHGGRRHPLRLLLLL